MSPVIQPLLKVFLCHSSADKSRVLELHGYLKKHGAQPWLDKVALLPGQDWETEISNAITSSDVIVVCLSKNSVDRQGYLHKEILFALNKAMEMPEGAIFIIPARLDECKVPQRLVRYHWVNLFEEGWDKPLTSSLNRRADELGLRRLSKSRESKRPIVDPPATYEATPAESASSEIEETFIEVERSEDTVITGEIAQDEHGLASGATPGQLSKDPSNRVSPAEMAKKIEDKEISVSGDLSLSFDPPIHESSDKPPGSTGRNAAVRKSIVPLEDQQPSTPAGQSKLPDTTPQATNAPKAEIYPPPVIEDQEKLNEKLPTQQRIESKPSLAKFKNQSVVTVVGIVIVFLVVVSLCYFSIQSLTRSTPTPSPTPTRLVTSTPARTSTATASQTSSPTATLTRMRTATPTLTATQTPTRTPLPSPTIKRTRRPPQPPVP